MAAKKQTQNEWSQGNRDLLVELKTQMGTVGDNISELRAEVKEIKDGVKTDIEFLKNDKVSRAELTRLQVDGQIVHNDHETRLRWHDKVIYSGLGGLMVLEFALNYFHPFSS